MALRRVQVRQRWARATASARNPCSNRTPLSTRKAGPARACRAPPSPVNRISMKRARSTSSLRPRRRASHKVSPIQYRTRLAYRKKRPSGPGTLGHHNLIYEVGPSGRRRRPYNRDTKARALPLRTRQVKVLAASPACHSSNSRRRSGAARAPATAVYRWWPVAGYSQKRAWMDVGSAAARRSLFVSSRAAPRAPLLLMQRRRAPATACPCARAAGAGGCPLL